VEIYFYIYSKSFQDPFVPNLVARLIYCRSHLSISPLRAIYLRIFLSECPSLLIPSVPNSVSRGFNISQRQSLSDSIFLRDNLPQAVFQSYLAQMFLKSIRLDSFPKCTCTKINLKIHLSQIYSNINMS